MEQLMIKEENTAKDLFHEGINFTSYEYLGVHRTKSGEFVFRTWAPHAQEVFVVGDFNGWGESCKMDKVTEKGVWELYINNENFGDGSLYKFKIKNNGLEYYKADPYATYAQKPPETASRYFDIYNFKWTDERWLDFRREHNSSDYFAKPMNIYEIQLGSWKTHEDGSYYNYREIAPMIVSYVKRMGYTHIELMPIAEHPFHGSWGYQICGFFAPTSRYGTPSDFMFFVNTMHNAGIGIILDWVPAHFSKDPHGLIDFDGEALYEYSDELKKEHAGWGTRKFDFGKNEVSCFLISNAVYWAKMFHLDGLRVDAVASMIYLDYDKKLGEWEPNEYGDSRCLEALDFLKRLNRHIKDNIPDFLMIAEESSCATNITSFANDGLGFSMKWDMGWMNDTLTYAEIDTYFRTHNHEKLTFSMVYAFGERHLLPISHDEVVHGKKSFLDKMPGDYWQKFANTRVFMLYMMTHPGKKLMFMGSEIGQFREWDHDGQIEWFLLDYEMHAKLQFFVAELNKFYLEHSELWECDDSWDGFEWIDADNKDQSIISFMRVNNCKDKLITVLNFSPKSYKNYKIGVPDKGRYYEVFSTDASEFGGNGQTNSKSSVAYESEFCSKSYTAEFDIPPLGGLIIKRVE